jgi:hypothetical protein
VPGLAEGDLLEVDEAGSAAGGAGSGVGLPGAAGSAAK